MSPTSRQGEVVQDEWLTARETSALTKFSVQTLANWRSQKIGPCFTKLASGRGGRIRYRRRDVEAWLASQQEPADA